MKFSAFVPLAFAVVATSAIASPPSYSIVHGEGVFYTAGPAVTSTQEVRVVTHINSGTAFSDPYMHFAIGGRGNTVGNSTGIPSGRGITLGNVMQSHLYPEWGPCSGIMIEDFASAQAMVGVGSPMDGYEGLVPGTCVPYTFDAFADYRVELRLTASDMNWWLYQWKYSPVGGWQWMHVRSGGCIAQTGGIQNGGYNCPLHAYDFGKSDAFVAAAILGPSFSWGSVAPQVTIH